jgi:hypothetical protein
VRILRSLIALLPLLTPVFSSAQTADSRPGLEPNRSNPILTSYYADSSVVQHGWKAYIHNTLAPRGDANPDCWESEDWKHRTNRVLNWPACGSPVVIDKRCVPTICASCFPRTCMARIFRFSSGTFTNVVIKTPSRFSAAEPPACILEDEPAQTYCKGIARFVRKGGTKPYWNYQMLS